jgi:D-erythro-7,8-dihydroneopterin triphosphate epimerase
MGLKDLIKIEGIEANCIIGINPDEKINPQPIIINLTLYTSFEKASNTDDINNTINYSTLVKSVKDFTSKSKFNLIETLGAKIAEMVLNDLKVTEVEVEIKKPNALHQNEKVSILLSRKN